MGEFAILAEHSEGNECHLSGPSMNDLLSELIGELLRLIGISVNGEYERTQALAMHRCCGLFGVRVGCFPLG